MTTGAEHDRVTERPGAVWTEEDGASPGAASRRAEHDRVTERPGAVCTEEERRPARAEHHTEEDGASPGAASRRAEHDRVTAPVVVPSLYDAEVRHVRRQALDYTFRHRVYLWLVDLDELPRQPWWLRPFAGFAARDHLGDPARSIRENLDAWLATQGVDLRGGQVLMLANARVLGYVFNPITVYWCHRPDGAPECVVAEVHNTYGERHCYLLRPDEAGRAETEKDFYVSPFFTVDGSYRMVLREPTDRLAVSVSLRQGGTNVFTATLTGTRRPATRASLARTVLRRPFVTHRTSALIRRHGITLWLRRLPVVPRPRHTPQEGVQ